MWAYILRHTQLYCHPNTSLSFHQLIQQLIVYVPPIKRGLLLCFCPLTLIWDTCLFFVVIHAGYAMPTISYIFWK
jgi:hypothetical protein